MLYDLPPLNAIRAFEAAARNLSFKKAARELNVTPGAVSQQIKRLETDLGISLFRRMPTSLLLTGAGQEYFSVVRRAIERISEATSRLRGKDSKPEILTVSVLPAFAIKWLVPRLGKFQALHPRIEVRITTSKQLAEFGNDDVDIAIRHGLGRYPGLRSWRLLAEDLVPVCSPKLLERRPSLRSISDLRHQTLLHDQDRRDWSLWLAAADVTDIEATRGPSFSDDAAMLEAAIAGQGVALGRSTLIEGDVRAGRLVKLFDVHLSNDFAYYIVCPEARSAVPKLASFRDWLLEEAVAGQQQVHRQTPRASRKRA